MDKSYFDDPYFDGKLTEEEKEQFVYLMNKAHKPTEEQELEMKKQKHEQEREFVDFFKGLIPILVEAYSDLELRGQCPDECKGMLKHRDLFKT